MVRYVVVVGGNWLAMCQTKTEALVLASQTAGAHVERWSYREKDDGTHEIVSKGAPIRP